MQNELRSEFSDKPIKIVGINEFGHEGGNALMATDRSAPILQDVDANNNGESDVWNDNWEVTYRDVKILNQQNELVGTLNLTRPEGYDLGEQANYDALKQIIADVAHERALWQNHDDPTDVNDDGRTSAVDALQCINELDLGPISGSSFDLPLPMPRSMPKPYLDVSGDGRITANDALRVINRLMEQTSTAEGESIAPADAEFEEEEVSTNDPISEFENKTVKVMSNPESASQRTASIDTHSSILSDEAVDSVYRNDDPFVALLDPNVFRPI